MTLTEWEYMWATTPEHARKAVWRAHRIDEILAGRAPRPLLDDKPTIVLHVFPETAFNDSISLPKLQRELFAGASGLATNDGRVRTNVDGIIAYGNSEPTYAQVFRDGIIEYASSYVLSVPGEQEVDAESLMNFLAQFLLTIPKCFGWTEEERTNALTLLRVKDHRFAGATKQLGFDRKDVLFPLVTDKRTSDVIKMLQQLLVEAHGQG